LERHVTGNPGHRGQVIAYPHAPVTVEVESFDVPTALTPDAQRIWQRLAPFAFANGTLTRATALAFEMLCRHVVLVERYEALPEEAGNANHRGLIQRVDTELLRFNLSPCGKPMYAPAASTPQALPGPPVNPLARFLRR